MKYLAIATLALLTACGDGTDNQPIPEPAPQAKYVVETWCTYGVPYVRYTLWSDGTQTSRLGRDC